MGEKKGNLLSDISQEVYITCELTTTTNFYINLQVTFEMLQMSQVCLALLFSWDGLEPKSMHNTVRWLKD